MTLLELNSTSKIVELDSIRYIFTSVMCVLLFFGIIFNCLNFLVFRQRKFRKSACALLCTTVSVINNLILIQGITRTILFLIDRESPENKSWIYCKFRFYIRHSLMMINRTCTILACAAAFALSSNKAHIRSQASRISLIYYSISICVFFWFIIDIHLIFNKQLIANKCRLTQVYQFYFSIYLFLIAGIISPILMIGFSLCTLRNLRRLRHRIRPLTRTFQFSKRDTQLIRMLLMHVAVYMLTTFLYPVNMFYISLANDSLNQSIESFITFFIDDFLFYLNNIVPFLTYYLSSSSFRRECRILWLKSIHVCLDFAFICSRS